ncbi:hypothetical protein FACS18949_15400 [Clostridia bacterium]|nr:hypothetical protein FACS18949_15400 [Clostridia bacterium]
MLGNFHKMGEYPDTERKIIMKTGQTLQSLAIELDRQNTAKRDFVVSSTAMELAIAYKKKNNIGNSKVCQPCHPLQSLGLRVSKLCPRT